MERFIYYELSEFSPDQITIFINRWFQFNDLKRYAFLKAFEQRESKKLGDLARSPLLLTLLCLIFEETGVFPHGRASLYEEAVDVLLTRRNRSDIVCHDQVYSNLSLERKRRLLAEIAIKTFERGEFFIKKRNLVRYIADILQDSPYTKISERIDGEEILRAIESQCGLLTQRAHNIYSFSHLTFQEYFAARYIAENANEQRFRTVVKRGNDPQWRDVLLVTAGMLDDERADLLFEIWSLHLREIIQGDESITKLLQWTKHQCSTGQGPNKSLQFAAMTITLLDQTLLASQSVTETVKYIRSKAKSLRFSRHLFANILESGLDINFYQNISKLLADIRALPSLQSQYAALTDTQNISAYNHTNSRGRHRKVLVA